MIAVQIPSDITVQSNLISFKDFCLEIWLSDARWGQTATLLEMCDTLKLTLREADKIWVLEERELEILREIVEKPAQNYNPKLSKEILTFIRAIK